MGIKTSANTRADDNFIKVMKEGRINSSQDGIVINVDGIAPTHTSGHGNTPKITVEAVAVTSITHQEHIVPEGGGFGWSTIDIILVKFSNSESQLMRLYNWYSSKEMISRNFTEELDYPVNNMDEALKMLFRALKGYVPDEYLCDTSFFNTQGE